ncbi:dihydrofolate reductase family protein [Spirillospora sp. CA-294931]|uniref:dihydrofolate reductase family protein n=1 Tax=Spirillospora sp. CA-294931 TaxID=3240042 RepID=UPI003D8D057A
MRKLVFHIQTTLDNRIANGSGAFWEPFPWGEEETSYIAEQFSQADTWALGRVTYEAIVPWWDRIARGEDPEDGSAVTDADRRFAKAQGSLAKVVFSTTMAPANDPLVIGSDPVAALTELKQRDGKDILLTCGPKTLASIAAAPGLIDEYLLAISPAVLTTGPRLFEDLTADLALELTDTKVFPAGAIVTRYRVR